MYTKYNFAWDMTLIPLIDAQMLTTSWRSLPLHPEAGHSKFLRTTALNFCRTALCHIEETEFFKISNLCSGHSPLRFASWWTFSENRTMEQGVRKMWAELMSRKRLRGQMFMSQVSVTDGCSRWDCRYCRSGNCILCSNWSPCRVWGL